LFVIQSGLAQVGVGGTVIARLRRGDVVGEQSLITGEPRSATVVAGVPTDVLELRRGAFAAVLARHPAVLTNLSRILSRRLARVSGRQAEGVQRGEAVALVTGARAAGLIPAALEATGSASPRSVAALDSTRTEGRGPKGEGREAADSARRTHHSILSPPLPEPGIAGVLAILDDLLAAHGTVVAVAAADDPH